MDIRQVQAALIVLGIASMDPGDVDGVDGPKTKNAVAAFQKAFSLPVTGEADSVTFAAIKHAINYGIPEAEDDTGDIIIPEETQTGTFWDKVQYFKREEFKCPCGVCGGFPVEPTEEIVMECEELRKTLGKPVTIIPLSGNLHAGGSGVRCQSYNDSLKGSVKDSRHVRGKAVDFIVKGASDTEIETYLAKRKGMGKLRYWYQITAGSHHMDVE